MATPRRLSAATFSCTAAFFHMLPFMAGASSTGQGAAKSAVESKSSAMPPAYLPIKLAVAGATTNTSANLASEMCPISHGRSNKSRSTR